MAIATTLTIGSVDYDVYGITADPVQDADDYLAAKIGSTWSTASTLQKQQAIVTAARVLDRAVIWSGSKTVDSQALQWPRDGAQNCCTGTAVTSGTIPDDIANAQFLLAGQLFDDASLADSSGTGSNIKKVEAGSAKVTFFSPTIETSSDTRLPTAVNDLAGCFIAETDTFGGSFGTTAPSDGTDGTGYCKDDYGRSEGYP